MKRKEVWAHSSCTASSNLFSQANLCVFCNTVSSQWPVSTGWVSNITELKETTTEIQIFPASAVKISNQYPYSYTLTAKQALWRGNKVKIQIFRINWSPREESSLFVSTSQNNELKQTFGRHLETSSLAKAVQKKTAF